MRDDFQALAWGGLLEEVVALVDSQQGVQVLG